MGPVFDGHGWDQRRADGLKNELKKKGGGVYSSSLRSNLFFLPLWLRVVLVVATLDLLDDVRVR